MEETEKMAREAFNLGPRWQHGPGDATYTLSHDDIARFEALVRADERERCAKVCDLAMEQTARVEGQLGAEELLAKLAVVAAGRQAGKLAAAIRALTSR